MHSECILNDFLRCVVPRGREKTSKISGVFAQIAVSAFSVFQSCSSVFASKMAPFFGGKMEKKSIKNRAPPQDVHQRRLGDPFGDLLAPLETLSDPPGLPQDIDTHARRRRGDGDKTARVLFWRPPPPGERRRSHLAPYY